MRRSSDTTPLFVSVFNVLSYNYLKLDGARCWRLSIAVLLLILLTSLSACRIISPSIPEQQNLISRGAFPSGIPSWVPQNATRGEAFVRAGYGTPSEFTTVARPTERVIEHDAEEEPIPSGIAEESLETEQEDSLSFVDTVAENCPGRRNDLVEAQETQDRARRTSMFENILSECQQSGILWYRVAEEYIAAGRAEDAAAALERVVELEPGNAAAAQKLRDIREHGVKAE